MLRERGFERLDVNYGFFGKLTSGKWAKIGKCSTDTALNYCEQNLTEYDHSKISHLIRSGR